MILGAEIAMIVLALSIALWAYGKRPSAVPTRAQTA